MLRSWSMSFQLNGSERSFEARVVRCGENILSVIRDISERKRANELLRQSEAKFREHGRHGASNDLARRER